MLDNLRARLAERQKQKAKEREIKLQMMETALEFQKSMLADISNGRRPYVDGRKGGRISRACEKTER